MAFREVASLEADVTTALGGVNKQTGKANPKQAEGYFLGSKKVESRKSKTGFAYLHILQTQNGNLGVWGKADLDRKLRSVTPGTMVRITQSGTRPTPNGDMYLFKVEIDDTNMVDVSSLSTESEGEDTSFVGSDVAEEEAAGEEEEAMDAAPPARPVRPAMPAKVPDAERQARVKALLAKR